MLTGKPGIGKHGGLLAWPSRETGGKDERKTGGDRLDLAGDVD